MAYLVVTAIHATGSSAQQPSADRVTQAFRQVLSPAAGFVLIGGAPRITRQVHTDQRQPQSIERGIGLLTIGAGVLAAPFTMGLSLVGPVASQAASRAASGAINSIITTTATAVVETSLTPAEAERKVQQDFASVLGNGWGRVTVRPFDPAVNGPFNDWYTGATQRNSATTATQSLVGLATAPRENPVAPTPPGSNIPGAGAVTDLIANASAATQAAVDNATNALRAGIATVTSAAGDGIRDLARAAGEAGGQANRALRDTLTTAALAVGGIAAAGLGVAYLIGQSTGRGTAKVAGDSLKSAFALTPMGRLTKNPAPISRSPYTDRQIEAMADLIERRAAHRRYYGRSAGGLSFVPITPTADEHRALMALKQKGLIEYGASAARLAGMGGYTHSARFTPKGWREVAAITAGTETSAQVPIQYRTRSPDQTIAQTSASMRNTKMAQAANRSR